MLTIFSKRKKHVINRRDLAQRDALKLKMSLLLVSVLA